MSLFIGLLAVVVIIISHIGNCFLLFRKFIKSNNNANNANNNIMEKKCQFDYHIHIMWMFCFG